MKTEEYIEMFEHFKRTPHKQLQQVWYPYCSSTYLPQIQLAHLPPPLPPSYLFSSRLILTFEPKPPAPTYKHHLKTLMAFWKLFIVLGNELLISTISFHFLIALKRSFHQLYFSFGVYTTPRGKLECYCFFNAMRSVIPLAVEVCNRATNPL